MIIYKYNKNIDASDLYKLFSSVHWESAKHVNLIQKGLMRSSHVISAWDDNRLVGLIRSIDDGYTIAFIHYLLVDPAYQQQHIGHTLMEKLLSMYAHLLYVKIMPSDPKTIPFYQSFGFKEYDNYNSMVIKRI